MATKKKAIDPWKTKQWFELVAPNLFNREKVAQIPAQDPQHLLNRIIEMPLKEITRDLSHMYINVKLRVEEVKGKQAFTKFIGHAVAREHLQALGRRSRSLLYVVFPVASKDGVEFSVKVMVVTRGKASGAQKTLLRNKAKEFLSQKIESEEFGKFIQEVIYGKAASELTGLLKKFYPIKRVEIYKTELKEVFDIEEQEKEGEPQTPQQEPVSSPA
ncbi:hypothetical protein HY571_01805 [Candidatus Micrarchaeota archaeon]|nr:hypothetical protein [Candidatus Micrarchaeota archaeon]